MLTKIAALAQHLGCTEDELENDTDDGGNVFAYGRQEYLVLTEKEADEMASERIQESVWAFNTDFIIAHSNLPSEAKEMIESFQRTKCDGANDTIVALINDMDDFVTDAISADGRGHFLAGYDNEETEVSTGPNMTDRVYVYRTN